LGERKGTIGKKLFE
jgi:hypothetical protein